MKTKKIPLSQGKHAIVDAEDYEWMSKWKWTALFNGFAYYAVRMPRRGEVARRKSFIYMHRAILNAPNGVEVDHKNRNGLDNRRCNIRLATRAQNGANRGRPSGGSSKYKGVSWFKTRKKWHAQISVTIGGRHRSFNLGLFTNEEEAARAYDRAALRVFKDFASINFPGEDN